MRVAESTICHSLSLYTYINTGSPPTSGLSSNNITGIIIGFIFLIFFLIPMGYYFGRDYWRKRHQYNWYNRLTTPGEWCDCCSLPTPQRTFNLRQNTTTAPDPVSTEPAPEVCMYAQTSNTVTVSYGLCIKAWFTVCYLVYFVVICIFLKLCSRFCFLVHIQPVAFGGFTRRSSDSTSSNSVLATNDPELEDPGLTKAPPPAYNAAANFPSVTNKPPQDLPPPYSGPAVGFVYPSSDTSGPPTTAPPPSSPPPSSDYPVDPAYPPPSAPPPSSPPSSASYPVNPAYPPPSSPPPSSPPPSSDYPVDPAYPPTSSVNQELPYPVNMEPGGGAYPLPTVYTDP